ncbi:apolipoprotein D-like, partial [Schistocerca nitens]|uniref:apolipoprotein D-like n=1 Tax=Schistocerca nitens TaxID=7011 RepID=UPI002117A952
MLAGGVATPAGTPRFVAGGWRRPQHDLAASPPPWPLRAPDSERIVEQLVKPSTQNDVVNWTATHRRDSDVVSPSGRWGYYDDRECHKAQNDHSYAANITEKTRRPTRRHSTPLRTPSRNHYQYPAQLAALQSHKQLDSGMRYSWALCLAATLSLAAGQVPGFGGCPVYQPMTNFDLSKYMGTWYEAERMFAVTEAGARCVSATYSSFPGGQVRVSNQITNRLTGLTRQLDGEIKMIGKAGEAKLSVKYSSLPVSIDSEYMVLDTDYDTYSIVWSCSSLGPFVNRQNAWIMTRERLAPGPVLQRAYGLLDNFKIRRTFFVKTDQENCDYVAAPGASGDAAPAPAAAAA